MHSPAQDTLTAPVRPSGFLHRSSVEERGATDAAAPFAELLEKPQDSDAGMPPLVASPEVMVEPSLPTSAGTWNPVSFPASAVFSHEDRGKGTAYLTAIPEQGLTGQNPPGLTVAPTVAPLQPALAHDADGAIRHSAAVQGPDQTLVELPGRTVLTQTSDRPMAVPAESAFSAEETPGQAAASAGRNRGNDGAPANLIVQSAPNVEAAPPNHSPLSAIPSPAQPASEWPVTPGGTGPDQDFMSVAPRPTSANGPGQTGVPVEPALVNPWLTGQPSDPPLAEGTLAVQGKTAPEVQASTGPDRKVAGAKARHADDLLAPASLVASRGDAMAEPDFETGPTPRPTHPSVQEHSLRLTMSLESSDEAVDQTPSPASAKAPDPLGSKAPTAPDDRAPRADQTAPMVIGLSLNAKTSTDGPIHSEEVTIGLQSGPATGASSSLHGLASAASTGTNGPSPHQSLVQQTSAALVRLANDGPGRIELTLSPETLGRVHFDMRPDATGLSITLSAERPETLDLIRRHLPELLAELRQAGVQAGTLSFGTFGEGRQPPSGQEHSLGHDQRDAPLTQTQPLPKPVKPGIATGLDLRL